jgi:hypothetical protein
VVYEERLHKRNKNFSGFDGFGMYILSDTDFCGGGMKYIVTLGLVSALLLMQYGVAVCFCWLQKYGPGIPLFGIVSTFEMFTLLSIIRLSFFDASRFFSGVENGKAKNDGVD